MQEHRRAERVKEDFPDLFTLSLETGETFQCLLKNMSYTGIMVEFFVESSLCPRPGTQVRFTETPSYLKHVLENIEGTVVWSTNERCGIRFSRELQETTPMIRTLLVRHGREAWGDWLEPEGQE